jgi:hypothetical protein
LAAAWIAESCSDETCSYATYYVAKTGNNTIGDGSVGKPWLMITKGANADKLNVNAGTYRETIILPLAATADMPISPWSRACPRVNYDPAINFISFLAWYNQEDTYETIFKDGGCDCHKCIIDKLLLKDTYTRLFRA